MNNLKRGSEVILVLAYKFSLGMPELILSPIMAALERDLKWLLHDFGAFNDRTRTGQLCVSSLSEGQKAPLYAAIL